MEIVNKLLNFFSRTFRYLVFSALSSFGVSIALIILNFILGVRVSVGFYMIFVIVSTLILTFGFCVYNSEKLFAPISKPLITRLEREKVERARQQKRREERRRNRSAS